MQVDLAENKLSPGPTLKLAENSFEGPLSLLLHLIEKNKMDINDIKVSEITAQYLQFLAVKEVRNEEIAAEFLVMASNLLLLKSKMLLPRPDKTNSEDPRTELVMQLIAYRRCKVLATELLQRQNNYAGCLTRKPITPAKLGLQIDKLPSKPLSWSAFLKACEKISATNRLRFQDLRKRVNYLLQKDKMPLKERINSFWQIIKQRKKLFFFEIFGSKASKSEQISGFLALLELLRLDQVKVSQKKSFDVILIEENHQADPKLLQDFLQEVNDYV